MNGGASRSAFRHLVPPLDEPDEARLQLVHRRLALGVLRLRAGDVPPAVTARRQVVHEGADPIGPAGREHDGIGRPAPSCWTRWITNAVRKQYPSAPTTPA